MSKSVLITGSSKGLGRALALEYAHNSYDVVIHGRESEDLVSLNKDIEKKGVNCYGVNGDIREDSVIKGLAEEVVNRGVEILINNAAIGMDQEFLDLKYNKIEEIIGTNLVAPIKLINKVIDYYFELGEGTIININGTGPLRDEKNQTLYRAAKLGLRGFTDNLRMECFGEGVRIMGVYIDGMQTDMYDKSDKSYKNCMNPDEVAKIIYNNSINEKSCYVSDLFIRRVK
jgi:3-oxoacyl-[acyl-carrier protein] reductase